jgi:hypothetical protein
VKLSVLLATLVFAILCLAPAAGAGRPDSSAPFLCGPDNTASFTYTHPSLGYSREITRRTATLGGCVSTRTTGHLTAAAISHQCKDVLSKFFPFAPYGYPISDMGDCIQVMGGLSSGELDPGPVDPFPYG